MNIGTRELAYPKNPILATGSELLPYFCCACCFGKWIKGNRMPLTKDGSVVLGASG
jgi:hypothetical protein